MVQVASIGGKNSQLTPDQADALNHMNYELDLSLEVVIICFIGFLLILVSCAGILICRLCPDRLPERIRNFRSHIYKTEGVSRKFPLRQHHQMSDDEYFFRNSFSHANGPDSSVI